MIYIKRLIFLLAHVVLITIAVIFGVLYILLFPIIIPVWYVACGDVDKPLSFLFEKLPDSIDWTLEWVEKKLSMKENNKTKNIKQ